MGKFLTRKTLQPIGLEIVGCLLAAIGIYNFAVMAELPMTGFTGVAILINRLNGFPIGVALVILNAPFAILCYRILGRRFFIHSIFCMVLFSMMIDHLAPLFPVYSGSRLLAVLACGAISGSGFAIILMQNASTGGTNFVVLPIKAKWPHLTLGRIYFLADLIPVVAGGLLFDDIDGIIYGLLVSVIFAVVIDRLIYGANAGKLLLIVADDSNLIRDVIQETSGRGCTIWRAHGGYAGTDRQMIMCACDNTQMYRVQRAIVAADPRAFTVVLESSQVAGQGFRRLVVGEKQG